jgi:methylthioribose-1-phosphate isomerase
MVVKETKKYPNSENDYDHGINTYDFEGKVKILKCQEYVDLINKIKTLTHQLKISEKEILNKTYEIAELEKDYSQTINELNNECEENIQNIQFMRSTAKDKSNQISKLKKEIKDQKYYDEFLKNLENTQHKKIKELDQQHNDKIEKIYYKFNEDLKKYITVNELQKIALKQILKLGFIDMLRMKHKKIVKNQIKELDQKPIENEYLTENKDTKQISK